MVVSTRRYYLLKRLSLRSRCLEEDPWTSKQASEPGTALPSGFPYLTTLDPAGYTTREDLDGATVDELREFCSLTVEQAKRVLAAAAAL